VNLRTAVAGLLVCSALVVSAAAPPRASAQTGPVGFVDAVSETAGTWRVTGWMWDPSGSATRVGAEVNGAPAVSLQSLGEPRPDVAAAVPGAPANTGYTIGLTPPGVGIVCVFALTEAGEKRALIGCVGTPPSEVAVPGSPTGALDAVTPDVGRVTVAGWAADPEAPAPYDPAARVHAYVDGRPFIGLPLDTARPDVDAAIPFAGPRAGYAAVLPARVGPHQICVYAVNVGRTGRNQTLGCRDVVVPASRGAAPPFGALDGTYTGEVYGSASRTAGVVGWAAAPQQAAVDVRVLAVGGPSAAGDGHYDVIGTTGESRPDVVAAFPGTRSDTGYHILAGGGHVFLYTLVCAVAHTAFSGDEAVLGCYADARADGTRF
jgi:hypothetical protein